MFNDNTIFMYYGNSKRLINTQRLPCMTKLESILSLRLYSIKYNDE